MSSNPTSGDPAPLRPPDVRVREGAHRGGGGIVAALLPSLLAVAAVAALITALAVWQGEDADRPSTAAATSRDLSPSGGGAGSDGSPTTGPTSTASETAAESSSPETSAPETSAGTSDEETSAPSDLEVVVLNQSGRGGLAGLAADALRSQGWDVYSVGNFRGTVSATTVYYPDGAEADARAVAEDLPTEPRVRPRFSNLSTTRLTVVVTDSYPG